MRCATTTEMVALRELNEAPPTTLRSVPSPGPRLPPLTAAMFTAAGFGDGWGAGPARSIRRPAPAFFRSLAGQEAMTIWANEELCIVPSNQVEYADPVQGAFAAQYEDGGYKVVADYNTGQQGAT